jgi:hypothetical protein
MPGVGCYTDFKVWLQEAALSISNPVFGSMEEQG